ncbi:MAG TPA: RpiB/LacA/LacB family sugar-phosphate isomerase [Solirubrobacteraceae bacterium]|nr:RpiB/LacA/LacB family sugar-phosphate isomerase [Solirubrobacteraceae bacterium]
MIVAVGVDYAGVPLRDVVMVSLHEHGHDVLDCGVCEDYPDIALEVARAVVERRAERGVLICGSGAGVGVAAGKVPGVRAQTIHDGYTAHQGVEHDAVNVLCIGARVVGEEVARELVATFAGARVSDEARHVRRRGKVQLIERDGLGATLGGE